VKSDYKLVDDSSFLVKHTAYKAASGQTVSVEVTSNVTDPAKPNRLVKTYPIKVFDHQVCTSQGVVYIWDTDYENYSLMYSCKPLIPGFLKIERAWIYSRKSTLEAETTSKLKNELKQKGVDASKFFVVNQHC
jgi:lipocalin